MLEIFQDIPGFDNYLVSNFGYVVNRRTDKILKPIRTASDSVRIGMTRDSVQHQRSLPLLVANSFIEQPAEHFNTPINLDSDRFNCRVDNLAWRPRWFANLYHKQFKSSYIVRARKSLEIVETGQRYRNLFEVCTTHGLLGTEVLNSAMSLMDEHRHVVFPIGVRFRFSN